MIDRDIAHESPPTNLHCTSETEYSDGSPGK